jgi:ElaB/YqjD/DUF883 family membrane-anchored ribosome-binding protein
MAEGTEPIRQDIEEIRGSLAETLDQIETRVRDNVDQTVGQVRQTVDWRHWVEARPLAAFGAAMLVGLWLGRRL